jgi:uncharacterized protein (TIGR02246 family)
MTTSMTAADTAAIREIVAGLVDAWNTADGAKWASHFTGDADFVNIFGMHGKGRHAIADAHDMIFHGVYAGSTLETEVRQMRLLHPNVALLHLRSRLQVPRGPMAGVMNSVPSAVLTRDSSGWKIAAFHNVLVTPPPPLHNNGQPR